MYVCSVGTACTIQNGHVCTHMRTVLVVKVLIIFCVGG